MDLKNMMGGGTIKYLLIGAVAAVIPTLIQKFLPSVTGIMLGIGMVVGGVFLMGKLPIVPQALIVSGGVTLLGGFLGGFLGGTTTTTATSTGASF